MFDPTTLLGLHSIASLVALVAGIVVIRAMYAGDPAPGWTATFLVTMLFTDLSGFLLPADRFLPSHATGILSLVALAFAIPARYRFHYAGAWRWIYVVAMVTAVWLDAFVAVVQALGKVPALGRLAPTQESPGFALVQLAVLALFIAAGWRTVKRYRPAA